jgi:hypothetical protein
MWPDGPFVRTMEARIPRDLRPDEQAEAVREARMVQDAVLELASEVRDYVRWRKRKRLPPVAIAREAGVSRARVTALEQGANWPR